MWGIITLQKKRCYKDCYQIILFLWEQKCQTKKKTHISPQVKKNETTKFHEMSVQIANSAESMKDSHATNCCER